jgi:lysophospholipase L1-like esterase
MPQAWAIFGGSLLLLLLIELGGSIGGLRPTAFLAPPAPKILPTPWPTPSLLEGKTPPVHTHPSQVARLLSQGPAQAGKPLRIAYFADSMIEGDLICEPLRRRIQQRFGGTGVGWVGMAPLDAWARDDIRQRFDPSWERHSLLVHDWQGRAYGPQMASWTLKGGRGGVQFKGLPAQLDYRYLAPATLWFGPVPKGGKAQVQVVADGEKRLLYLEGSKPINKLAVTLQPCQKLDLNFEAPEGLEYFGISFDQGSGVDCFSSRGSHGGQLSRMDLDLLKGLQASRHYDLVIAQFGINALGQYEDPQFKWYRRLLSAGLKRVEQGLPGSAVLLVSAADRAVHGPQGWVSDPDLPGLLAAQRAVAFDAGVPFISAFDLMGGSGSMARWAQSQPRLAEHDFTNMSALGAQRFEESLWQVLQKGGHLVQAK